MIDMILREYAVYDDETFYDLFKDCILVPGICTNCLTIQSVRKEGEHETCVVCGARCVISGIVLILTER
jgi:hypothetical protein